MLKKSRKKSSPKLLLDFLNIRKWTHKAVLELYREYGIIHTLEGRKYGFEIVCFSKKDPKKRYFILAEHERARAIRADVEKNRKWFYPLPSEKGSVKLFKYLQESQKEYMDFLNQCSMGVLDLAFAKKIAADFSHVELTLIRSKNEWKPELTHGAGYLGTLEDYVNWEIFTTIVRGEGGVFPYVKKCRRCQKYFVAKILRKDQKYCRSCSRKKGYATDKSKDERAEYMRRYRRKMRQKKMLQEKEQYEAAIRNNMENLGCSRKEAIELYEADKNA
jgi:hypothetical protein